MDYLTEQKGYYTAARDSYIKQINDSETEAVRQLILVATVFLTGSLFIFQGSQSISGIFRYVMVLGWVSFALSMSGGIWIFLEDRKFFEPWANASDRVANAIADGVVSTPQQISQLNKIEHEGLKEINSPLLLRLQIIFLLLGITSVITVGISLLFKYS